MTAKLRKVEETVANEPLVLEPSSREAPMIAEHADCRLLQPQDPSGRRLRNRVIVANAIAWIVIVVLIRLIFF
jgi:hypothetical protein